FGDALLQLNDPQGAILWLQKALVVKEKTLGASASSAAGPLSMNTVIPDSGASHATRPARSPTARGIAGAGATGASIRTRVREDTNVLPHSESTRRPAAGSPMSPTRSNNPALPANRRLATRRHGCRYQSTSVSLV